MDVPAIAPDPEIEATADKVIRDHVGLSMLAAAVPVPLIDLAGLTAIRLRLVWALARCYAQPMVRFDRGWKGLAPGLVALADDAAVIAISLTGRAGLARSLARSLAKGIPVVGPALGLAVSPAIAGSVTYAMGKVIRHFLRQGGDLKDFDADAARADLEAAVAEGQQYVAEHEASAAHPEPPAPPPAAPPSSP